MPKTAKNPNWRTHLFERGAQAPFKCPVDGCTKNYNNLNSLQKHTRIKHQCYVGRPKELEMTPEERNKLHNERRKAVRDRLRAKRRDLYTIDDAKSTLGMHVSKLKNQIVKCDVSDIEEAGVGVCACETLFKNDIVTFYSGEKIASVPKDASRTMQYNKTGVFMKGCNKPKIREGLAAFINKEDRTKKKYANCEFVAINGDIFVEIKKKLRKARNCLPHIVRDIDYKMGLK